MKRFLLGLLLLLTGLISQAQTLSLHDLATTGQQLRTLVYQTSTATLAPTGNVVYQVANDANTITLTINTAALSRGQVLTFLRSNQTHTGTVNITTTVGGNIIQQADATSTSTIQLPATGNFRIIVLIWNTDGYFLRLQ